MDRVRGTWAAVGCLVLAGACALGASWYNGWRNTEVRIAEIADSMLGYGTNDVPAAWPTLALGVAAGVFLVGAVTLGLLLWLTPERE